MNKHQYIQTEESIEHPKFPKLSKSEKDKLLILGATILAVLLIGNLLRHYGWF